MEYSLKARERPLRDSEKGTLEPNHGPRCVSLGRSRCAILRYQKCKLTGSRWLAGFLLMTRWTSAVVYLSGTAGEALPLSRKDQYQHCDQLGRKHPHPITV